MIIPTSITNFDRSNNQLLEFAIFAVCVAGKNPDQTAKKVGALWEDPNFQTAISFQWGDPPETDIRYEQYVFVIGEYLKAYKIGQYDRLSRVIYFLNQNREQLRTIMFDDLVNFKGIGPKTAAFFLLHSRRHFFKPVIDTHICKYMATKGIEMKVTSSLHKYLANAKLVRFWIRHDFPDMSMAEADLHLWTKFSGREDKPKMAGPSDTPQPIFDFNLTNKDLINLFGKPNTKEI